MHSVPGIKFKWRPHIYSKLLLWAEWCLWQVSSYEIFDFSVMIRLQNATNSFSPNGYSHQLCRRCQICKNRSHFTRNLIVLFEFASFGSFYHNFLNSFFSWMTSSNDFKNFFLPVLLAVDYLYLMIYSDLRFFFSFSLWQSCSWWFFFEQF